MIKKLFEIKDEGYTGCKRLTEAKTKNIKKKNCRLEEGYVGCKRLPDAKTNKIKKTVFEEEYTGCKRLA